MTTTKKQMSNTALIESPKLKVRIESKAKNEPLAELVDRFYGIKNAAREVGVCKQVFSDWLNFRSVPTYASMRAIGFTRFRQIVLRLEKLTGVSITDIFPLEKADIEPLAAKRRQTVEVGAEELAGLCETKRLTFETPPVAEQQELSEAMDRILQTLPQREANVLKMRWGIPDGMAVERQRVAKIFNVTPNRIDQIEKRAMHRLKEDDPELAAYLREFIGPVMGLCPYCRRWFRNENAAILHKETCPERKDFSDDH